MPRTHRATYGLETCMFSPLQMHAEHALRLATSAAMEALAVNHTSLQAMIEKAGLGLVIVGANVHYEGRLTFFSATTVATELAVTLREDGRLMHFLVHHAAGQGAVTVDVKARPIQLSGGAAMDAAPAAITGAVRASFADDEIERAVPTRALQAQIDEWTSGAEEIGGGDHAFFIGRTDCELADQWQYLRLPSHVASAREQLALGGAKELAIGLKRPIKRFFSEYRRPMYFGDRGRIELKAYRKAGETFFTYRVLGKLVPDSAEDQRPLCAIAVEIF